MRMGRRRSREERELEAEARQQARVAECQRLVAAAMRRTRVQLVATVLGGQPAGPMGPMVIGARVVYVPEEMMPGGATGGAPVPPEKRTDRVSVPPEKMTGGAPVAPEETRDMPPVPPEAEAERETSTREVGP